MGAPRTLKNIMVFRNGVDFMGSAKSFTPPKLARKLEDWRGAGMDGSVKLDMGQEPMTATVVLGGPERALLAGFGGTLSGENLRFAAAHQRDDTGEIDSVEYTCRGRLSEADRGDQKPGDAGDFKHEYALSYYREEWNGQVAIEIDLLNMICIVEGVDRLAEMRAALGV